MKHRKNPCLVKVKTIIPSEYVKEIMTNISFNSVSTRSNIIRFIDEKCIDVRKNSDDNTSLIQKEFDSFRNYVEKSFIILFIVLFFDCLVNILG